MKNINISQIESLFYDLEIKVNNKAKKMMTEYVNMLIKNMSKCRLTGEQSSQAILEKQVYDSLYPLKNIGLKRAKKIIDLGTGAGMPGIPIKIVRPDLIVTLLDSNRKKALFLKETIDVLGLREVYVINRRAEEIGQELEHRENYSYVISRAVAKMDVLAELALPLLKSGGEALLYKGPGGEEELENAEQAIVTCGGVLKNVENYNLKSGEVRKLYVIKKTNITPNKYPRKPGMPGKKPITGK